MISATPHPEPAHLAAARARLARWVQHREERARRAAGEHCHVEPNPYGGRGAPRGSLLAEDVALLLDAPAAAAARIAELEAAVRWAEHRLALVSAGQGELLPGGYVLVNEP